jgi:hypothetical protein
MSGQAFSQVIDEFSRWRDAEHFLQSLSDYVIRSTEISVWIPGNVKQCVVGEQECLDSP